MRGLRIIELIRLGPFLQDPIWRMSNKRHSVPSCDVHRVDHSFWKVFGPAEDEAVGASLAGRSNKPMLPRGGGCSAMAMMTRALLRSLANMEAMRGTGLPNANWERWTLNSLARPLSAAR